jgi:hypothetical protein
VNRADVVERIVASITAAAKQLPDLACYVTGVEMERDLRMTAETLDDLVMRLHVEQHRQNVSLLDAYDETGHVA